MPSPPLVIPNAVQVRLLFNLAGSGAVNVLGAQRPAGLVIDQTITNTVGAAIKAAWSTNIGPLCIGNVALVRVGLRDLGSANRPEFLDSGAQATGTAPAGDSLPPSTAMCITLKTALSGKSFRGRVYLGGFDEAQNGASGAALQAAADAGVAFITAIGAALTASTMTLAVLSRPAFATVTNKTTTFSDGSTQVETISRTNAHPGTSQAVTLIQSRNLGWETQRRRANQRGAIPTLGAVAAQQFIGAAAPSS